jgi:hypothetical protein
MLVLDILEEPDYLSCHYFLHYLCSSFFFCLFFYSHLLSSLTFSHGDTFGSGVKKFVDFCFMNDGYLFAFLFTNFKKHSKMILFSGQVEDVVNKVKAFSMTACMQDVSCRLLSLILAGTYILNPGCIH